MLTYINVCGDEDKDKDVDEDGQHMLHLMTHCCITLCIVCCGWVQSRSPVTIQLAGGRGLPPRRPHHGREKPA
jgi:hypothetical protein